ncbi:hypothetical protein BC831DRAFT_447226 [Entophlyctis helioformis]|nr:hypothetical protein BC831DRAFT_447226 [Entophlyctis helioformis]
MRPSALCPQHSAFGSTLFSALGRPLPSSTTALGGSHRPRHRTLFPARQPARSPLKEPAARPLGRTALSVCCLRLLSRPTPGTHTVTQSHSHTVTQSQTRTAPFIYSLIHSLIFSLIHSLIYPLAVHRKCLTPHRPAPRCLKCADRLPRLPLVSRLPLGLQPRPARCAPAC